jgi:hypothetical protein
MSTPPNHFGNEKAKALTCYALWIMFNWWEIEIDFAKMKFHSNGNIEWLKPHDQGKSFGFMECTLIIKSDFNFNLSFTLKMWRKGENNGKWYEGLSI